jgi:hypothetical protein
MSVKLKETQISDDTVKVPVKLSEFDYFSVVQWYFYTRPSFCNIVKSCVYYHTDVNEWDSRWVLVDDQLGDVPNLSLEEAFILGRARYED